MKKKKDPVRVFLQAAKSFGQSLPLIIGVILLLGLFKTFITQEQLASFFSGNPLIDTTLGALLGSISGGQVINSYIIGGELLDKGVSLFAVTAFLLAWVTVGIIQLPAEMAFLGNRFALLRNISGIFLAMAVSAAIVFTMGVIV